MKKVHGVWKNYSFCKYTVLPTNDKNKFQFSPVQCFGLLGRRVGGGKRGETRGTVLREALVSSFGMSRDVTL